MKKGLIDWDLLNFEIDRKLWLAGEYRLRSVFGTGF